jgi:hypothetical protein
MKALATHALRVTGHIVGALGLFALATGCASTSTGGGRASASGYDVLVTHDGHGQELTIVPQAGIAFRTGSPETQEVRLEWTTANDVVPGKMLVWNPARTHLIAQVDTSGVDVRHESGDPFGFSLEARHLEHAVSAKAPKVEALRVVPTPSADEVADEAAQQEQDAQDEITYAASDATLGVWNRAPALE